MFAAVGHFVTRYRWPIILAWIAVAVIVTLLAPSFDEVASSDSSDFLPDTAPFVDGYALLAEAFPDDYSESGAVIVIEVPDSSVREGPGWDLIVGLTDWLQGDEAPENIAELLSPGDGSSLFVDSLIAPDDHLAIMLVNFKTNPHSDATRSTLDRIGSYLESNPQPGADAYITGSAPIIISYTESTIDSADRTTGVTIVLVVLILLLVYRSPVSPIVPLLTVAVAYLISRGIAAWLGAHVMTITNYANVLLIVVLFGAGTDYCLFLISRFREEMADDSDPASSTVRTVHRVGETITSSAGTVIVGFVAMAFAEMGLFNTTGPALAIGIVVVLLAGLTLTPALLDLLGQWAFWPGRASHRSAGRLYGRVSVIVSQRPVLTIVIIVIALAPLAVLAAGQHITYDMLADLPASSEARLGFQALERHMGGGQIQPLNIVINDLNSQTALTEIDHWTQVIQDLDGVADVRSLSDPLGQGSELLRNITSVSHQFSLAASMIESLAEGAAGAASETTITPETIQVVLNALPFIQDYLDALESRFLQVAGDEDLAAVRQILRGLPVAALTGSINDSLTRLQTHLAGLSQTFASIDGAFYLPESLPQGLVNALGGQDPLLLLSARYLRPDRTAARLEVILEDNPYGDVATDVVRHLRSLLPGGARAVSGYSAIITDLRDTMDRDMLRSFALVLVGIFVVLVFLLRALVSPVYLILTILLSYGATLGITRVASEILLGTDTLTWWVPFFMFVMLVALGMDYNIFLMGRVKEEVTGHGMREGVHRAVGATGAIITSAGIIMAGTFASMMAGLVTGLRQLGFAVAVGVLIDTFIIRTALVPAIAVLLDRWNWWPGKAPRAAESPESLSTASARITGD